MVHMITTPEADGDQTRAKDWHLYNRQLPGPIYGLIRLECEHRAGRRLGGAILHVAFGRHAVAYPAETMISPTSPEDFVIRVHLVTHLVANGRQRLSAHITWPDGVVHILPDAEFDVRNIGELAGLVRRDLQDAGTNVILGALVDSRMFPQSGAARAWFNDESAITDVPLSMEPAPSPDAARMHLIRWGFTVLDYKIDQSTITQFRSEYEAAIDDGRLSYVRGSSERVHQAHLLPAGNKIWLDPYVIGFLREWFRDEPCACQTLLYINGSEQDSHQDTVHLTPYPAGFMCGVWVALQDVQPDSGELFVLPGSHKTPRLLASDLGLPKVTDDYSSYARFVERIHSLSAAGGYEVVPYRPRAGQVLVWHENLIHGGLPRKQRDITRHSIVSHYFARGSIAYYDSRGEAAWMEQIR